MDYKPLSKRISKAMLNAMTAQQIDEMHKREAIEQFDTVINEAKRRREKEYEYTEEVNKIFEQISADRDFQDRDAYRQWRKNLEDRMEKLNIALINTTRDYHRGVPLAIMARQDILSKYAELDKIRKHDDMRLKLKREDPELYDIIFPKNKHRSGRL